MRYTFTVEPTSEDDPQDVVTISRETDWDDLHWVSDYLTRCLRAVGFGYVEGLTVHKEGGDQVKGGDV